MRRLITWFLQEEHRHRHFQCCISLGVIGSTVVGYLWPYHAELAIVAGVATNMLWIWER